MLAAHRHRFEHEALDPFPYMADILERIVSGAVKVNDLDRLLPWV